MSARKRPIVQPIFDLTEETVARPLPQCAPVDVVVGDSDDDDSIEEIELNVNMDLDIITSDTEFWNYIKNFKWVDATSNSRDNKKIVSACSKWISELTKKSFQSFRVYFDNKYVILGELLISRGVFPKLERTLNSKETRYLLNHIILRGEEFYNTIIQDPFFVGYLVGKTAASDEFHHASVRREK